MSKGKMSGEKFLSVIYKDLATSKEVIEVSNISDSAEERIRKYMEYLEKKYGNITDQEQKNAIFKMIQSNYVINIDNARGQTTVVEAQKESLNKWLTYLFDPNTKYPTWAKYWAFQGMIKIGTYDEKNGKYGKRSERTIAPFIELNPEILAKCIDTITKVFENESIEDEELSKIAYSGSFSRIYTYYIKEVKKSISQKINDGKWVKYNYESVDEANEKLKRGETPEYLKLYNSLQEKNTGWCTAGSKETAKDQICGGHSELAGLRYPGGDFYVYYTQDEHGEYTMPRIAIRMEGTDRIGEIRGVGESQNVEEGLEDVIKDKLDSMDFVDEKKKQKYMTAINDSKALSNLNKKVSNNIPLTAEEQRFLFGVDRPIEYFGWLPEGKIDELKNNVVITDMEVAKKEISNRGTIYYSPNISAEIKSNPEYIEFSKVNEVKIMLDDSSWDEEEISETERKI